MPIRTRRCVQHCGWASNRILFCLLLGIYFWRDLVAFHFYIVMPMMRRNVFFSLVWFRKIEFSPRNLPHKKKFSLRFSFVYNISKMFTLKSGKKIVRRFVIDAPRNNLILFCVSIIIFNHFYYYTVYIATLTTKTIIMLSLRSQNEKLTFTSLCSKLRSCFRKRFFSPFAGEPTCISVCHLSHTL